MKGYEKARVLSERIRGCRNDSLKLWSLLKVQDGFKYTVNHDVNAYPAAVMYGTWSAANAMWLILGNKWEDDQEKDFIAKSLLKHRLSDGTFLPKSLFKVKTSKSVEYLKLHCYNYATEALLRTVGDYDFQSRFMDRFLDADFLNRWLDQRSLERPWEESNNIVNVASYIALCHGQGKISALDRMYQLLEWHRKIQNPKTGGFDNFSGNSEKHKLQSLAGAVHNFHIHLYLNEPFGYEEVIARNLVPFLFRGPLTACLSIDFVELACRVIDKVDNRVELIAGLLHHLESLIAYQNEDGGWYENESSSRPTSAAGMREQKASSCSYATWFRLCSLGMIDITLLGGKKEDWNFRRTLGMGYAPDRWNTLCLSQYKINETRIIIRNKVKNFPSRLKNTLIRAAARFVR